MREEQSVIFVSSSSDEPIRLSGPPQSLSGSVRLRNPHGRSLVLRDMALSDRSGRLAELPPRHAFRPVVLRAGEERTSPFAIALDPLTPPGEYHVEFIVAGQPHPAVLNITELVALRVEPRLIVVTNEPGRKFRKHVVVTNEGNTLLTIGGIGDVELRDDLAETHDFRAVIGQRLEEVSEGLDDVVAALVVVAPPRGPVAGRLSVHMHGEPLRLEPGRTVTIDLDIVVPPGLVAHGRYRGRAAISTADIEFVVAPGLARAVDAPGPVEANPAKRKTKPIIGGDAASKLEKRR